MSRRSKPTQSLDVLFRDLLQATPAERERKLARLDATKVEELFYGWSLWARPDQRLPEGDWIFWLILAGRGAGKTRAGAETVRAWAKRYEFVNLIGATRQDARE